MSDIPVKRIPAPEGYADWLADLKTRIHTAQQRAAPGIPAWRYASTLTHVNISVTPPMGGTNA